MISQHWCHYLSQCWPRSLSSYGVTRPQWVNTFKSTLIICFELTDGMLDILYVDILPTFSAIYHIKRIKKNIWRWCLQTLAILSGSQYVHQHRKIDHFQSCQIVNKRQNDETISPPVVYFAWRRYDTETFPTSLALCARGIHRSPTNSKGQWCWDLKFRSLNKMLN